MRRLLAMIGLGAVLMLTTVPTAAAVSTGELESCFLDAINAARTDAGAPLLTEYEELSAYGRDHSGAMAAAGSLYHSTPAEVDEHLPPGWVSWGENVGYATGSDDCAWLFEGFWESPDHRDNLLNPAFDLVGIGVIVDGEDTMWTTHLFVDTGTPPATTTTTTAPSPTSTTPSNASTSTTSPAPTSTSTSTSTTIGSTAATTEPASPATPDAAPPDTETRQSPTSTAAHSTARPSGLAPVAADTPATAATTPTAAPSPGCVGCGDSTGYTVFLAAVAAFGLAISWWAIRG